MRPPMRPLSLYKFFVNGRPSVTVLGLVGGALNRRKKRASVLQAALAHLLVAATFARLCAALQPVRYRIGADLNLSRRPAHVARRAIPPAQL